MIVKQLVDRNWPISNFDDWPINPNLTAKKPNPYIFQHIDEEYRDSLYGWNFFNSYFPPSKISTYA